MASTSQPRIQTYLSDGAIAKGEFVIKGSDKEHVAKSGDGGDVKGICQNEITAAEQVIEVALPGGGAKVKLGATLSDGDLVSSDANAKAKAPATGNRIGALLQEDGVLNDLVACEVIIAQKDA